ncbi:hypothetical protein [Azonexus hydrophilus]|uniref:hypothetical protein n=1 Tax=Azonexus hydrophilus TaxID=418702 RepID=UPI0019668BD7|nr:hypothetical protein [Azonexus hydrophilus]
MDFMVCLRFTLLIILFFWGCWFINVQLDRLNGDVFSAMKKGAVAKLREASGVFRVLGFVFYSPYIAPARALCFYIVVFVLTLFL